MKVKDLMDFLVTKCKPDDEILIQVDGYADMVLDIEDVEVESSCEYCEKDMYVFPEFTWEERVDFVNREAELKEVEKINTYGNLVTLKVSIKDR